ncbi:hypothetical protein MKX03_001685 [Papaver bracteatum]|nr:hypothetical protein MKX03_001685 [Papaver bracteatum]
MMKVEVVSKEIIKPSCSTPHHLKTFNLSYLDQIAPPSQIALLLYYANDHESENRIIGESETDGYCSALKKSLAETIIDNGIFPIFPRIIDNSFVDCNDDGVDYFETKVRNCQLSQLIQLPNVQELAKTLLPFDPFANNDEGNSTKLLSVQVNVFGDCGGIVIGLCISHKLADACSVITFINDWASITRVIFTGDHDQQIKGPLFEAQSLFPLKEFLTGSNPPPPPSKIAADDVIVAKKFVFGSSKLAELKKKAKFINEFDGVHEQYQPTRFEALSALIRRCFIDTDQAKNKGTNPTEVYLAVFAINLRARMIPSLPLNSFGNVTSVALPMVMSVEVAGTKKNDQQYYPYLVGKVKDSLKKIDGDYVRDLQTSNAFLDGMKIVLGGKSEGLPKEKNGRSRCRLLKPKNGPSAETLTLGFTSWCRLPIYEANFGWGKPIWVGSCAVPMKNVVSLMDTNSSGDGIEAWVSLSKEDMDEFERHPELVAYVS